MGSKDESLVSKVQTSYQKLATAASTLNTASDRLGKVVAELDTALKGLNLGITSWLDFSTWEEGAEWATDQIGYTRIGGKWGIAIRKISGNYQYGEDTIHGEWLFSDAPRALRITAIDRIPEFLEKLVTDVEATTKRVNEKLKESHELAEAIAKASGRAQERGVTVVSSQTGVIS